jgi:molecular chaperone GrpE
VIDPQDKPPGNGPAETSPVTDETAAGVRAIDVETLRQALAELEDAKARLRRDNERELDRLRAGVLESLLPVLDNLERSMHAAENARTPQAQTLLDGIKLVHAQFLQALQPLGLERVSTIGARFDPKFHDAVAVVPVSDPLQDGTVIAELEPAYRFAGRIVRPAKVQVGRAGTVLTN